MHINSVVIDFKNNDITIVNFLDELLEMPIRIGAMKMFDNKTTHIISIIDNDLQSIGFDTQLLGYANIKKYPKFCSKLV